MTYATAEDVKAIWPGFPAGQETRAAALLEDAAVRIDAYAPPPLAPIEVSAAELAVRKTVSREMVVFVMMADSNVDPVTQKSRTMGPFSESWSYDRPGRTLMLTEEHKRMLRPRTQQAFTVPLVSYPPTSDPLWWLE
ncbi:Gp19/Gp15/Gp42 family protein [Rathayibacter sp. AY1B8]|uniref:Gp19/Gp15/Gp42 family protein n=1 Tax=Rathayibacter sp. AY1B8 TaxID=2080533 RepID=UPI000CE727D7|nr:Gp19/Gp15/Gp42 family protein [Rathayibacter sp. AY1B8]PPI08229.1 hypothetical protein C5C63_04550 [Rathayibacter sp. AY1B8]